jgi:SAICAR synthetase
MRRSEQSQSCSNGGPIIQEIRSTIGNPCQYVAVSAAAVANADQSYAREVLHRGRPGFSHDNRQLCLPRWLTRYIIATTLLEWKRLPKVNSMFWESRSHAAAKCAKSLIRAIVCYLSRQIGSGSTAKLILVGECLAPDSSRFWPGADYVIVENPLSFDNDSCAIISRRSIGIKSRRRLRCRRI